MRKLLKRLVRLMMFLMMYPFAKRVQHREIPVLAYHSVDDNRTCPFSVSREKFQRQIRYLRDSGYQSISLRELVAYVEGAHNRVGRKSIILTFDDGFENFDSKVLPILKRYGYSGVLSVVGEFCSSGRTDTYDNGIAAPALSWDEVRRISAEGVEIASHGMRHVKLTSIPLEEANWEIRKSKEQIEAAINTGVDFFFYPHGACNGQIASLVRRNGYRAALTTSPGLVREGDDIYALRRIMMKQELSLLEFKAMITPAVDWYSSLLWGKIGQAVGLGSVDIF
jgi:peptidoglycan/xylan/chitin deacetylase (PgdA/CDA1 family)